MQDGGLGRCGKRDGFWHDGGFAAESVRSSSGQTQQVEVDVMAVLCDTQIRELVTIEPFSAVGKRPGQISFGLSSYGYDVRVGTLFKVFTNVSPGGGQAFVDPNCQ